MASARSVWIDSTDGLPSVRPPNAPSLGVGATKKNGLPIGHGVAHRAMRVHNWFAMGIAVQYVAAAAWEAGQGRWVMMGLWLSYAVATGLLAVVDG